MRYPDTRCMTLVQIRRLAKLRQRRSRSALMLPSKLEGRRKKTR